MLQSLRTCAISVATASILASGLRAVLAPASAAANPGGPQPASAVSSVHYLTSGPNLVAVELTLPGSGNVKVRLAAGGSWYGCTRSGSLARCQTPGQTVKALERVEVERA